METNEPCVERRMRKRGVDQFQRSRRNSVQRVPNMCSQTAGYEGIFGLISPTFGLNSPIFGLKSPIFGINSKRKGL